MVPITVRTAVAAMKKRVLMKEDFIKRRASMMRNGPPHPRVRIVNLVNLLR